MRSASRLLASELVKILTLRSVQVTLLVTFVVPLVLAFMDSPSSGLAVAYEDLSLSSGVEDPETVGFDKVGLVQVGLVVLGVLAASSEYRSGQLTTSLLAAPRRLRLLAAKSAALFLVSLGLAAAAIPALSLLSQHLLGDLGVVQGGVPPSLLYRWLGAAVYWVAIAQISFALAVLMRQASAPLFIMILAPQLTFVILHFVPLAQYLPFVAGIQLFDASLIADAKPQAALAPPRRRGRAGGMDGGPSGPVLRALQEEERMCMSGHVSECQRC